MNLYLVEAGATHRFALGKDRAEAVYEAYNRENYGNVNVYYITTLTDCTRDFTDS
jgi:type VI protein secretion system component Hcp